MWDDNKKEGSTNENVDDWATYYPDSYKQEERGWEFKKFSKIAVAVLLLAVLLFVRQSSHPVGVKIKDGLQYVLTTEWDYQPILEKAVQVGLLTANYDGSLWGGLPNYPNATPASTTGMELLVPVSGQVVKGFGWVKEAGNGLEKFHSGIDICAAPGSPVRAAMAGKVERIGSDQALGSFILINHGGENYTLYAQVDGIKATEGQDLAAGEIIASVGTGGEVPGYGIHFEAHENGKLVDPLTKIKREEQKW